MAPDVGGRVRALIASGQLKIIAGKIAGTTPDGSGLLITLRRRGRTEAETLHTDRFVDCSGVHSSPARSTNPVIRDLIAKGLARGDPLGLGLDVDADWALIDARGRKSERLFAIGPLTRAAAWETTAIPDIRLQCTELSARLLQIKNNG
jgi:uncharacterized NAD(P)/FAD-binding protein YdhS